MPDNLHFIYIFADKFKTHNINENQRYNSIIYGKQDK